MSEPLPRHYASRCHAPSTGIKRASYCWSDEMMQHKTETNDRIETKQNMKHGHKATWIQEQAAQTQSHKHTLRTERNAEEKARGNRKESIR